MPGKQENILHYAESLTDVKKQIAVSFAVKNNLWGKSLQRKKTKGHIQPAVLDKNTKQTRTR